MTKKSSKSSRKYSRKSSAPAVKRLKKVIFGVMEGKTVKQSAMDAGYSESYAESGQLTRKLTWQELMEKHFPDDKLAKVAEEGLKAVRYERVGKTFKELPDYSVRHKYYETNLKLKSKFPAEKQDITHTFANDERPDEEVERIIEEQRKFFNKK